MKGGHVLLTSHESEEVEREIYIAARPETIFSFFTDPAKIVRWLGIRAQLNPQPGGIFRVNINERDVVGGKYLEVVPYSRVVFTWGWEGSPLPLGSTTVEITLVPDAGGTTVYLRHLDIPAEQRGFQAAGWDHTLQRLIIAAEGGDPGPDPWATAQMG
jgi:uncharacterized protein YndB with AHSA1/START domain